jgi:peptidoglycan/xylan/chitin deacetylase (PgdA/CDA1 family)
MIIDRLRRLFSSTAAAAPPTAPAESPIDRYSALCRACGIDRLYLLLTFDCDTDGDIDAVGELDGDLCRRGIAAGYAVPGVQLQKGEAAWRRVADRGAEFLNHGGRAHAEFRDGRYWPATFYEQLPPQEVIADIREGDRLVRDIIGRPAEGFRAPHFGSFQRPEQLDLIYETVAELGYRYCSTTIPAVALERGPIVSGGHGVVEVPTMGSYRYPPTLLDSWTYLTDRVHYTLGEEYYELFEETVRSMSERRLPGLLTYYADPSHVLGQTPFARALDAIAKYQIPSLLGRDVVRRFKPI